MEFHTYTDYTTHKIVYYKVYVSIYKWDNAINIQVQPKVSLNAFLGL